MAQSWSGGSPRVLKPKGARIRVLVVDDSVVIRRMVAQALAEDSEIEVVGAAANGKIALAQVAHLSPDVITLDVEMPEMGGLETLRHLQEQYPAVRVIMFSTLTEQGGAVTLEALSLGACDYVAKPANLRPLGVSLRRLREELIPRIKQFFCAVAPPATRTEGAAALVRRVAAPVRPRLRRVIAMGSSTGGPNALARVFSDLPAGLSAPVVLVQHMPPLFTRLLADRLEGQSKMKVREAQGGEELQAGIAYVAPGNYHMVVERRGAQVVTALNQEPPENSCRPAADVLFRSVAEIYGGEAVAVILTGMGQDGLRGIELLKKEGAYVIAQDEASSVVWGMPGFVAKAGLADEVAPLDQVAQRVLRQLP